MAGLLSSWTTAVPSFLPSSPSLGYKTQQSSWTESSGSSTSSPTYRRSTLACSLKDLRTAQTKNGGVIGDVSYDDGEIHICIAYFGVFLVLSFCSILACAPARLTFANIMSCSSSSGEDCVWRSVDGRPWLRVKVVCGCDMGGIEGV